MIATLGSTILANADAASTAVSWFPWLVGWAACAVAMAALWFVQWRTSDAGIVDVGWSACIGGLSIWFGLDESLGGSVAQRTLAGALGGVWGLRLAYYLLTDRVLRAEQEDGRYRYLRAHWGASAHLQFIWFFQAQALLAAGFAIPFFLLAHHRAPSIEPIQWLGLALCAIGVVGEFVADRQLARFRREPSNRGTTCRVGLWRYSRHPNYFFTWIVWCGFGVVSYAAPHGIWMVTALPVVMYLFLTRLTGIPYTEAQAIRSRGDDYRRYQRETSAFFPLPPSQSDEAA